MCLRVSEIFVIDGAKKAVVKAKVSDAATKQPAGSEAEN
jgi:hypothetical protein